MTIEFHCPVCQKLLKTADDKAGVRANCPGCGQSVTVPDLVHEAAAVDSSLEPAEVRREALPSETDVVAHEAGPADAEGVAGQTKACPMCGAEIKLAAKRCRFCGEDLVDHRAEGLPTRIDAGDILSTTWDIFQKRLGLLVGSTLVLLGISLALNIVAQVIQGVISFSMIGAGGRPPANQGMLLLAIYAPAVAFGLLNFAVNCYLQAGYHQILLKVSRGENAEVAEMFSGGRFFWRILLGNLLFTLIFYFGLLLLVVPGVFVALMFWPFMYAIVDRDVGVVESFRRSRELTAGNYMASVILGLAAMGAQMAGALACFVGLIFSTPFVMLIFAVAYCVMSGQAVARSRRA